MARSYSFSRIILESTVLRYAYIEFQWKLYKKLLKSADSETILLANDLDTLLPNYLVSRKLNIPLVYDSHEIFTEMPSVNGRFTQKIWRSLESFIVPKLNFMMTASESYADWFRKTYEIERPVVVQNFPLKTANPQRYSNINSKKIILYQGVINPSRGLDKMIPAMQVGASASEAPVEPPLRHVLRHPRPRHSQNLRQPRRVNRLAAHPLRPLSLC